MNYISTSEIKRADELSQMVVFHLEGEESAAGIMWAQEILIMPENTEIP